MRRLPGRSTSWLHENGNREYPFLTFDLTQVCESNTISVMMLNRQGATFFSVRCLEGEISP